MFNFKLIFFVIFLFKIPEIRSQISDKRLCANEDCTKQISQAKTLIRYSSPDRRILSFLPNVVVNIYSKSAGTNLDVWGVEINGKRGYAPKKFLRETKVFVKKLPFLVDTELEQVPSTNSDVNQDIKVTIKPNKVAEYDVVDGTTIYYGPDDGITPATAEATVEATIATENNLLKQKSDVEVETLDQGKESDDTVKLDNKVNEESKKLDDKVSEESKKLDDKVSEEQEESKESLVENVFQSLSNWINDKEDNEDTSVDNETGDDTTEDIEEDEEYDEIDDEDDSEEIDDDEDINTNTINEVSSLKQENEEVPENERNVNSEDIVKSRQLLGEKGTFDKQLDISSETVNSEIEVSTNEEIIKDDVHDNSNTVLDTKESDKTADENKEVCSDETCLNTKDEKKEEKVETPEEYRKNEPETIEHTTESAFIETLGTEIPLPYDYVTPSSEQDDKIISSLNADVVEQVSENNEIDDNVNEDNLGDVDITNGVDNLEPNAESEKTLKDTENNAADKSDTKDNIENTEKEGSEIFEQIQHNETVPQIDVKLNEFESTDSAKDRSMTTEKKHLDNFTNEEDKSQSILNVKNDETLETSDSNQDSSNDLSSTESSEKSDVVNQANIGDVYENNMEGIAENIQNSSEKSSQEGEEDLNLLSGIYTNWFSGKQDTIQSDDRKEEIKINNDPVNQVESVYGESVQSIESHNRKEEIINNDQVNQVESAYGESVEPIENHDHSFSAKIGAQEEPNERENTESSEVEHESATPETPSSETIEKMDESDVSQEELDNEESEADTKEDEVLDTIIDEYLETEEKPQIPNYQDHLVSKNSVDYGSCPAGEIDCPDDISTIQSQLEMEEVLNRMNFDFLSLFTVLGITGLSVVLFLLGYITIDKNRKEGPLIAKINSLEKALLVSTKENEFLIDKVTEMQNDVTSENDRLASEELENLQQVHQETLLLKSALEDQIQSLEKELENSTEVGLELNRMLSDILSSQNGSDILIANVEQLQRQLVEQQDTINSVNDTLNLKDTETHELQLELEIKNKKVTHLQAELDKMAMNLFKVEEDKEQMQAKLESEIIDLKDQLEKGKNSFNSARTKLLDELNVLKTKHSEVQRNFELKTNEYTILKENFNQIKAIKNNSEALESLLNASAMKAELQQLQRDSQSLSDMLKQEQQTNFTLEKQVEIAIQEAQGYKAKYDESDKEKLEALTKLQVLSNYFKEKEGQLQKELSKQESMWMEQQGEATSTVERIRYMQEELQNCKSQNELLKQEIVSQEVELKSQISVLEKKAHESWVFARQAERRLEDAKQEAAQLRNRLTLKERSFIEDKGQNRLQSPLEQNGDIALSPLHMPIESPASPPLLYGTRDHLTTSPPIPNMPPFLPPPPGVPFMPPPIPGVPGFMPPPPSMFPVDHRPPPLGRMSSPPPPLNSRYSPDSRYSPYDRNTPSPPYDDEYGSSPPPMHRGYSPYNNRDDRRDYKRPPPPVRTNGRNKGAISSGSGNSNESLEKLNRHHSKV